MHCLRNVTWAGAVCVAMAAVLSAAAPQSEKERPKLSLKAAPKVGRSPARVVLTAELTGGPNDFEEYYCPSISWDWGDGTESESTIDCDPYEAGKSEIKRRFTIEHIFKGGNFTVSFRLKRRDKVLTAANVSIQIQPGIRDIQ